jgi:ATP-binding cassette, subfamily F, member 3
MVAQPVGTLSGGEKARLVLAMLVWQRPNLLLLDEPTNHLDLNTREALSMALNEFEGTVMLVSHDRALLREVCDEFWLVAGGEVKPFDGDLDDYQRWLLEQSREAARQESRRNTAAGDRKEERRAAAQERQARADRVKPLRKEQNRIDHRLGVLFSERGAIEAAFAGGGLDAAQIDAKGQKLKTVTDEIDRLESRWLELSTQIDALEAEA